MAKTKDYKINISEQQNEYNISAKNKTAVYLKGINQNDIDTKSFKIIEGKLLFSANGKKFTISNYSKIKYIKTDTSNNKTELLNIISNNLVDNTENVINTLTKPYYNKKKLTVTGTNYNDKIDYSNSSYAPKGKTNIKNNKGLTINGGNGNDTITGTDYNDKIKGGAGDDIIIGGKGKDNITGGKGKNTIKYSYGDGNDTINLSTGEELIIDLTECKSITELSDLKYSLIGKNLIITVPDEDKNGTITLKNYTKNILKSLSFDLYNKEIQTFNNLSELTNSVIFDYKNSNLSKKGVLTASSYNDKINVTNTSNKTYTINAGNGENDISISGGKNIINSGAGNDTLHISESGTYTVNAGAGINTVSIDNSNTFGIVTINEQKVGATNKIVLSNDFNPTFTKLGNDLKIIDENGQIVIKSYYANVKNKSVNTFVINDKEFDIETLISDETINISGSGKITGTVHDDIINITGKKAVTINAGKGDDIIGTSKGNRTIYLKEGDGNDTVLAGKGVDIFKFDKGTTVKTEIEYDVKGNPARLIIHYGTQGDSVTYENYNNKKNIYYYIGSKKYSVSSSIKKGNSIKIKEYMTHYDGTKYNDTIIDSYNHTLEDSITIYANDGDDYIDAHHDVVYGGGGNDYIHAINSIVHGDEGNDIIINYGAISTYGTTAELYGDDGNDTIINNKNAYTLCMSGGSGDDTITNDGTVSYKDASTGSISGDDGNDTITNNGTVQQNIHGGQGNDTIINNGSIENGNIYGDEGNDIITNKANISSVSIYGGDGNDTITNEVDAHVDSIYGNDGKNTIINNGHAQNICGGDDKDTIINNGEVAGYLSGYIVGGKGDDTIITGTESSAGSIKFSVGDGNDILHLNAKVNNLNFDSVNINSSDCDWSGDDFVIKYNDGKDSVTIKDYDPYNTDIVVNISSSNHSNYDLANIAKYKTNHLYLSDNDDNITLNKHRNGNVYCGNGSDTVINNNTIEGNIYGEAGEDNITNNGTVIGNIEGGEDNDIITNNEGASAKNIYGNDGVDTITNKGTVTDSIDGGVGNDIITNEIGASIGSVYGGDGNDKITNNGTVSNSINGGAGEDEIINNGTVNFINGGDDIDIITNNGTVHSYISGGAGDDVITTTASSSAGYISFANDSGNDTLYLNASENVLQFASGMAIGAYDWSGDDFVIPYNNDKNYITIKNYDPYNTDIKITLKWSSNGYERDLSEIAKLTKKHIAGTDEEDNITINDDKFSYDDVYLGNGNDTLMNNKTVDGSIYGESGADNITNNGTVTGNIDGGAGNDTIMNNGTVKNSIKGGAGDDTITNEKGATVLNIYGEAGNDNITNNGSVTGNISGGSGNNTIVNNGIVQSTSIGSQYGNIFGSTGENTIINNGTAYNIYGCSENYEDTDGADEIINKGTIYGSINGGGGNDIIHNYGEVGSIVGGKGDDTIYTYENSSASSISLAEGEGTDTLYLNAKVNYLRFSRGDEEGTKTYTWDNDDLVITLTYESKSVTAIIKNYNPSDTNKVVKINTDNLAQNFVDLETRVPDKPQSTLAQANLSEAELYSEVTAFTTSSSSDILAHFNTNTDTDVNTLIAEYTYKDM